MSNSQKVRFARLLDWVEGRLPDEESAQVAEQVAAGDGELAELAAWLQAFVRLSQSITLVPPPALHERLMNQFKRWAANRPRPGTWERLTAALTFDSRRQLILGVRAVDLQAAPRQLIFSSSAADLTLHIQPHVKADSVDVIGQVFPGGDGPLANLSLQLLQDGVEVELAMADELYEFSFSNIPAGIYQMLLQSDQFEILISPLELSLS